MQNSKSITFFEKNENLKFSKRSVFCEKRNMIFMKKRNCNKKVIYNPNDR